MNAPTKRAPSIATYGYDAAGNPVASVNGVPTDPTEPDDTRELYVVEFLGRDAAWLPHPVDRYDTREEAERYAGVDDRVTRYVPDDQSAVLRGKLETLEGALLRLRLVSSNVELYRDDLVPGAECELCAGTGCMILSGRRCYACNGTGRGEGDG